MRGVLCIRRIITLLLVFMLVAPGASAYTVEQLLGEYAQKADLSTRTKKESAGYLIVFTRADLDAMKIKTLSELVNEIPFLRYNENAAGLSDVNYTSFQTNTFNPIVVYLNDRQMVAPFSGNGFQLLGQLDMSYIDHVEVYLGIPSYEIGFDTAATVIKLYTKKGYRENATVVSSSIGSRGTNDTYVYSGRDLGNGNSYFLYLDKRDNKRKKVDFYSPYFHKLYTLSRNKYTYNFYGEFDTGNFRFESQAVFGKMDNFIGQSWYMTVDKNRTDFRYLYGGIYYTSSDDSWKASINYSFTSSDNTQKSDGPLGVYLKRISPGWPGIPVTYNTLESKLEEKLSDVKVIKTFKIKNDLFMFGVRGRYRGFNFKKNQTDNDITLPGSKFSREYVASGIFEAHHMFNKRNMVVFSAKLEKHFVNGGITNFSTYGGRVGYIFNSNRWTFKAFLFSGANAPTPYVLYRQNLLGKKRVSPQIASALSAEITYRKDSSSYSLLLSDTRVSKAIYFSASGYRNAPSITWLKSVSFRYRRDFDPYNRLYLNLWAFRLTDFRSKRNLFGGYIALFNRIGRFTLYNCLSYRGLYGSHRPAYNLSSTLTYRATRNLVVYLKGTDLLNRAITTDYYRFDPINRHLTVLKDVPVFDRTVWLGVEYKF